uniref:CKLF-like MARVEL transmembrane domain-containing protein 5 n=1 Tax=Geotrypetes seraphini TaxID=260995 RepID=A0A6P8PZN5_GEOSA|nr:CKLF-like MARVEL transmembrane domain-containing protein 5 [Geotrypetes seraphini]
MYKSTGPGGYLSISGSCQELRGPQVAQKAGQHEKCLLTPLGLLGCVLDDSVWSDRKLSAAQYGSSLPEVPVPLDLLALCTIVFICLLVSLTSHVSAALLEFFITLAFLFIYSTHCYQRFPGVNWLCMDFLRCVSAVIIFLAVSITAVGDRSGGGGGAISAALFGFLLTAVFSYDIYEIYHYGIQLAEMQNLASPNEPPASRSDGCALN